ncbi:hypothetical protein [Demequina litorisediminis]|uniref:hypothetical protein n=1 Tax=Demequina litorisediminis TaxID=1849022 RepID=UPI0032B00D42
MTTVGVLALQGDVREHAAAVTSLGADVTLVRRARERAGRRDHLARGRVDHHRQVAARL